MTTSLIRQTLARLNPNRKTDLEKLDQSLKPLSQDVFNAISSLDTHRIAELVEELSACSIVLGEKQAFLEPRTVSSLAGKFIELLDMLSYANEHVNESEVASALEHYNTYNLLSTLKFESRSSLERVRPMQSCFDRLLELELVHVEGGAITVTDKGKISLKRHQLHRSISAAWTEYNNQ